MGTDKPKLLPFKPSPSQIEVIPLNKLIAANTTIMTRLHRVDFYQVFIFGNCCPKHWVDFMPIQVEPYSLLFINKGRIHKFDPSLLYDGYLLVFTDAFFSLTESDHNFLNNCLIFNDIEDQVQLLVSDIKFKKITSIIENIQSEFNTFEKWLTSAIQKNLLHNLLLICEHEKRKSASENLSRNEDLDYCLKFKRVLEEQFTKSKNVGFYSEHLMISERRLATATSNILGKLPKEAINARIILEAKRLLVHGKQSVKEIAYRLGFDDPTYFVKYFKKFNNCTPLEFREQQSVKN